MDKFPYLGQVHNSDCRDNKDVEKQSRRQKAVGKMMITTLSFAQIEGKINLFKSHCYSINRCALWSNCLTGAPCSVNWCKKSYLRCLISFELSMGFQNFVVINKIHPLKKKINNLQETYCQL